MIISVQCIAINFKFKNIILDLLIILFLISLHTISKKEKFLFTSVLYFCLPCLEPNFSQFFLPFEQLAQCIKPLWNSSSFYTFHKLCFAVAYKGFHSLSNPNWYPLLKLDNLLILKTLAKNSSSVITNLDKDKINSCRTLINRAYHLFRLVLY